MLCFTFIYTYFLVQFISYFFCYLAEHRPLLGGLNKVCPCLQHFFFLNLIFCCSHSSVFSRFSQMGEKRRLEGRGGGGERREGRKMRWEAGHNNQNWTQDWRCRDVIIMVVMKQPGEFLASHAPSLNDNHLPYKVYKCAYMFQNLPSDFFQPYVYSFFWLYLKS